MICSTIVLLFWQCETSAQQTPTRYSTLALKNLVQFKREVVVCYQPSESTESTIIDELSQHESLNQNIRQYPSSIYVNKSKSKIATQNKMKRNHEFVDGPTPKKGNK